MLTELRTLSQQRPPAPHEVEQALVALHNTSPAITEKSLGACVDDEGLTGYDRLVELVPRRATSVLELGCGNGPVLERLAARKPALERLAGVDLCRADLALARARVPSAELRREPMQSLSFDDASFDVVLSHHALYLARPADEVAAQVAHVLCPGGLLGLVTWTLDAARDATFAEMMAVFSEHTKTDAPHFTGWGDRRHFTRDGLDELFVGPGYFEIEKVEERSLKLDDDLDAAIDRLVTFFYSAHLQRDETKQSLRAAWRAIGQKAKGGLRFPYARVALRRR